MQRACVVLLDDKARHMVSVPGINPVPLIPVVVGAFAYERRARTLAARGRPVAISKRTWFWLGIVVTGGALYIPDSKFWSHMSEHLLLGDIGPLLIVLGLDGALLRPLLGAPGLRRLRGIGHPAVALPLWTVTLVCWHLPPLYDAALRHDTVHALQHVSFFTTGALMWSAVIEPVPGPAWFGSAAKAAYTLVVRVVGMALANAFIWSDTAFYDRYSVHDQRIGGAIMFTEGGIVTLAAFMVLFLSWIRESELRQQLIEAGHDPSSPRLRRARGLARSARSASAPDRSSSPGSR